MRLDNLTKSQIEQRRQSLEQEHVVVLGRVLKAETADDAGEAKRLSRRAKDIEMEIRRYGGGKTGQQRAERRPAGKASETR